MDWEKLLPLLLVGGMAFIALSGKGISLPGRMTAEEEAKKLEEKAEAYKKKAAALKKVAQAEATLKELKASPDLRI